MKVEYHDLKQEELTLGHLYFIMSTLQMGILRH